MVETIEHTKMALPVDNPVDNYEKEGSYPQEGLFRVVFIVTDPIRGRWFGWILD